jgi:hypothetical protein
LIRLELRAERIVRRRDAAADDRERSLAEAVDPETLVDVARVHRGGEKRAEAE